VNKAAADLGIKTFAISLPMQTPLDGQIYGIERG